MVTPFLLGLAPLVPILSAPPQAPRTIRVNVDSLGRQADKPGLHAVISGNGRHVVFVSRADNLVTGGSHGILSVFIHDLDTGITERVSESDGGISPNGDCLLPVVSGDGRYVAYCSHATNLVSGDTNGQEDVFVRDRLLRRTVRVSVDSAGMEGNGMSAAPSISADGRYVSFWSAANNLVPGDGNGVSDTFVHDLQSGQTTRVSLDSTGGEANGWSGGGVLSAHGRFVAFISSASNLVPGDTNNAHDVFLRDRWTGRTTRVSVDSAGLESDGDSYDPAIAAGGRVVAFSSVATNLVPGDTNGWSDVFVHDLRTGVTTRASVSSVGAQGTNRGWAPSLSADGRVVAFVSDSFDLVPEDGNRAEDIFVHDLRTGLTTRVSVDAAGREAVRDNYLPTLSADGRAVAFCGVSYNLVPGDTNGFGDVFVHTPAGPALIQTKRLVRGTQGWLVVQGAVPRERVRFYASLAGTGPGPCLPQGRPCLDLLPPVIFLGEAIADRAGEASLAVAIPRTAPMVDISTQAVLLHGTKAGQAATTNTITAPILP